MSIEGFEGSEMPADNYELETEVLTVVERDLLSSGHDAEAVRSEVARSAIVLTTRALIEVLSKGEFLNQTFTEDGLAGTIHQGWMTRLAPDEVLISTP